MTSTQQRRRFWHVARLVLLLLAGVFWSYFVHLVRREEKFLRERYGDAYRDYERRVGRWWSRAP